MLLREARLLPVHRAGVLRQPAHPSRVPPDLAQAPRAGWRIYWNASRVVSLVSYKAHLMMAVKLFEIPPDVRRRGRVRLLPRRDIDRLSLACALAGRELILSDSFEGMPAPAPARRSRSSSSRAACADGRGGPGEIARRATSASAPSARGRSPTPCRGIATDRPRSSSTSTMRPASTTASADLWPHLVQGGFLFFDEYVLLRLPARCSSPRPTGSAISGSAARFDGRRNRRRRRPLLLRARCWPSRRSSTVAASHTPGRATAAIWQPDYPERTAHKRMFDFAREAHATDPRTRSCRSRGSSG